jgi:hypothetical protein
MPAKHPPLPGTLASFAESGLPVFIVCNHCGGFTRPDYIRLVHQAGGWSAMVADFASRMRCTRCKHRGARFTFERPRGRIGN